MTPATLLPEAVKELRDRLDFDGAILSADLVATTATAGGTVGEAAVEALQAGRRHARHPRRARAAGPGLPRRRRRRALRRHLAGAFVDALERIAALRAFTRDAREPVRAVGREGLG